jgi:hypothetical protein
LEARIVLEDEALAFVGEEGGFVGNAALIAEA